MHEVHLEKNFSTDVESSPKPLSEKRVEIPTKHRLLDFFASLTTIAVCAGILFWLEVHSAPKHPAVRSSIFLLFILSCISFIGVGVYLTYFVEAAYGPEYEKSHQKFIEFGAASFFAAFVSSMVALWPAYGLWTLLLSPTVLTLLVRIVTIVPSKWRSEFTL